MAKPRIFISSTYYDLKYIRDDLDIFIQDIGYEPVRHEVGGVAYGSQEAPEKYAYKEVELCDILVCIIGGRYGTEARDATRSITQTELKHALEKGIQVFLMVEQSVHTEHQTYLLNKENPDTKYRYVDDRRVFEFIDFIYALPNNNPIKTFNTSKHIVSYLKDQWSGLFQRFLSDQRRMEEVRVLSEMKSISSTLKQLVDYLSAETKDKDQIIKNILLVNHPAFRRFAKLTRTAYRVFFQNAKELNTWLIAKGFKPVEEPALDEGSLMEWVSTSKKQYIRLTHQIFDEDERLLPFSDDEWKDDWLTIEELPTISHPDDTTDDVPF